MNKNKKHLSRLSVSCLIALLAWPASSLFAQTVKDAQTAQEATTAVVTQAQAEQHPDVLQKRAAEALDNELTVKSYSLKFISTSEFMLSAKFYVMDYSGTETTLTVKILKKNIAEFEALLKKLDVEKKNIQFQVYTIVASKEAPLDRFRNNFVTETKDFADKDLKRVLDEMKGLWNFKYYWVDSPSFLVVKDGAGMSRFKLVSNPYDFDMNILHVRLRGDEPGKRIISVGQINLIQSDTTLINTSDVTFKEKGYLVVGVSGFNAGWSGSALILVISAEIK